MQQKAEGEPSFRDAQDSLSKFAGKFAHYYGPSEEPLIWLEVARGYHSQLLRTSHACRPPQSRHNLGLALRSQGDF